MTVGVACCRLPTQHCERCEGEFLDEELDTLYRDDPALYCAGCRDDLGQQQDRERDEEFYGA